MNLQRKRYLPPGLKLDILPQIPDNFWGAVFKSLYESWGDPYWWPGEDSWEVAVGAILTQNTAWTNVEKALENLTTNEIITADDIIKTDSVHLGQIIRSSGYYNSKAKKLKELAGWWNLFVTTGKIIDFSDDKLRSELLNIWGVGKETADSIACYAFGRPVFVVDAYTKRILVRLQGLDSNPAYDEIQKGVYDSLPRDSMLYNHLHGLLVILGKEHCKARITECLTCPLVATCTSGIMKQTDNKKTRRNENPGSTN